MNVYKKNYSFSIYEILIRIFVNIKEESIIFNKILFLINIEILLIFFQFYIL